MAQTPSDPIVVLDGHTLCPGLPDTLTWEALRGHGELTVYDRTPADPPDLIVQRCAGAPYVLTNKTPLTRQTIAALPELRYIGVLATGVNVVDLEAAAQRGIVVTNVPNYGTDSVAQHVFALLLALTNAVAAHDAAVRAGRWSRGPDWSFTVTPLVELAGKTLGIVGLGSIGKRVARIGASLGMSVAAAHQSSMNRVLLPGVEVQWMPLDELFGSVDVLSLHCPLTEQTRELVSPRRLGRMKPTSYLINTSRGPLVHEGALAAALQAGAIAGAGLDVLSVEPPLESNPLLRAPRCVITPHVAWATAEARRRLLQLAANNLRAFQLNRPQNVVTPG